MRVSYTRLTILSAPRPSSERAGKSCYAREESCYATRDDVDPPRLALRSRAGRSPCVRAGPPRGGVDGGRGSGALTALVASSFAPAASGLLFMLLYGIGAMFGMALLGGTVGVPLARVMRTRWGAAALLGVTGAFSLVLGFVWGWPIVHAMV